MSQKVSSITIERFTKLCEALKPLGNNAVIYLSKQSEPNTYYSHFKIYTRDDEIVLEIPDDE